MDRVQLTVGVDDDRALGAKARGEVVDPSDRVRVSELATIKEADIEAYAPVHRACRSCPVLAHRSPRRCQDQMRPTAPRCRRDRGSSRCRRPPESPRRRTQSAAIARASLINISSTLPPAPIPARPVPCRTLLIHARTESDTEPRRPEPPVISAVVLPNLTDVTAAEVHDGDQREAERYEARRLGRCGPGVHLLHRMRVPSLRPRRRPAPRGALRRGDDDRAGRGRADGTAVVLAERAGIRFADRRSGALRVALALGGDHRQQARLSECPGPPCGRT